MSTDYTGPTGQFEFNESQNEVIGTLARRMSLVGIVLMVFGVLQIMATEAWPSPRWAFVQDSGRPATTSA